MGHFRDLITLIVVALVVGGCAQRPPASPSTVAEARAELRSLIEDVTQSTEHRYRLVDDRGRWMDGAKVIWVPEAASFAAVYHAWDDAALEFDVHLATSPDLLAWSSRAVYAAKGSQPTIGSMDGGGYVLAWEQEPDPIHNVIESFASWEDLLANRPARHFDVPITMQACGEGTPDITAASPARVDLTFHYHAGCERDLEAQGSTDWTSWTSTTRRDVDSALIDAGVEGHIGDRDSFTFRGYDLTLIEGQVRPDDWSAWRIFLYDAGSGGAEELTIRTHAGSVSVANPTIESIQIAGHEALLVTVYLFSEGARGEEDGPLLYYRTVPGADASRSLPSDL